jgi:hypothetical protein
VPEPALSGVRGVVAGWWHVCVHKLTLQYVGDPDGRRRADRPPRRVRPRAPLPRAEPPGGQYHHAAEAARVALSALSFL